jgi:hypothetical protein
MPAKVRKIAPDHRQAQHHVGITQNLIGLLSASYTTNGAVHTHDIVELVIHSRTPIRLKTVIRLLMPGKSFNVISKIATQSPAPVESRFFP